MRKFVLDEFDHLTPKTDKHYKKYIDAIVKKYGVYVRLKKRESFFIKDIKEEK